MNRKKALVTTVLVAALALVLPVLQGCASGSYVEARPQAMDSPAAGGSQGTVPG